jgi:arylsulfatase B
MSCPILPVYRLGILQSLLLTGVLLGLAIESEAQSQRPNIVLIVADDLGWNDVSFHGGDIPTPNLDSLAANGVTLDRFYVSPNCSPTRAGLLSGQHAVRLGLDRAVIQPWDSLGIPPAVRLLPEWLAEVGYQHRAVIGKWHLGNKCLEHHPLHNGFTTFYGSYNGQVDYYTHQTQGQLDWHRDFDTSLDVGYVTDLLADEAIRFIEQQTTAPFLLYLPFTAPHTPLVAPEHCLDRFPTFEGNRRLYAAMVSCLDDAIGRVVQALEDQHLLDNTLLFFTSDNGGQTAFGADNTPLKGRKGETWEGGIRVPAFVHWPAGLSGGRVVSTPLSYIDVLPTLVHIADITPDVDAVLDGMNALDVWAGTGTLPERSLFSFTGPEEDERTAVILGNWKLVRIGPSVLQDPIPEATTLGLYNLDEDPQEATNLADKDPSLVDSLVEITRQFLSLRPALGIDPGTEAPPGWQAPPNWTMIDCTPVPEDSGAVEVPAWKPVQTYPNPFRTSTTLEYTLEAGGQVHLVVYNLLMQKVVTLVDSFQPPGTYHVPWFPEGMGAGVYLYRLEVTSSERTYASVGKVLFIH